MSKDINQNKFPEETKLKLQIFAECFREWIPVFIHDSYIKGVLVLDFFAGTGKDSEGNFGSPLILLNEAKLYCNAVKKNNSKSIHFIFNEKEEKKCEELKNNIETYMKQCKDQNNCGEKCICRYLCNKDEFKNILKNEALKKILSDKKHAKFVLLDQYGFSQVDEEVFKYLILCPKTDFIFFISSSFIKRFKDSPSTKHYFNTENIHFSDARPMDCHRLITKYYQDILPPDKEYYLHHFTIKKDTNYWGLIFCTNHSLGMEKFLRVCWKQDPQAGEANFPIENDYPNDSLFYNKNNTVKKEKIKNEIRQKILSREIIDNLTGLKFALKKGCQPKIFIEVMKELEKEKCIEIIGDKNYSSSNIHKITKYNISLRGEI